jgi:hypothetical protein
MDEDYPIYPRDSTGRFCPFPESDPQYGQWDHLQGKAHQARANWFTAWNRGNRRRHKYWQGVAVKIRDKKLRILKRLKDRK